MPPQCEFKMWWIGGSAESPREIALEFWPFARMSPGGGRRPVSWWPPFVAVPSRFRAWAAFCYLANGLRHDARYARQKRHFGAGVTSPCGDWWIMRSNIHCNSSVQSCFLFAPRAPQLVVVGEVGGTRQQMMFASTMEELGALGQSIRSTPTVEASLWPTAIVKPLTY
jgi:hypothetical protein